MEPQRPSDPDFSQLLVSLIIKYAPLYILSVSMIGLYLNFLVFYVYPQLPDSAPPSQWLLLSTPLQVMTACFLMWLWSLLRAIMTAPTINPQEIAAFTHRKKSTGGPRQCQKCLKPKPDDSHHCSICGVCVLRFEHHSDWIACCIGRHNYKYYVLALMYMTAALGLFVGTFWRVVKWEGEILEVTDTYAVVLYTYFGVGFAAVARELIINCYLIVCFKTNFEYKHPPTSAAPPPTTPSPFPSTDPVTHPVRLSLISRIRFTFGPNPLLWLFPLSPFRSLPQSFSKPKSS